MTPPRVLTPQLRNDLLDDVRCVFRDALRDVRPPLDAQRRQIRRESEHLASLVHRKTFDRGTAITRRPFADTGRLLAVERGGDPAILFTLILGNGEELVLPADQGTRYVVPFRRVLLTIPSGLPAAAGNFSVLVAPSERVYQRSVAEGELWTPISGLVDTQAGNVVAELTLVDGDFIITAVSHVLTTTGAATRRPVLEVYDALGANRIYRFRAGTDVTDADDYVGHFVPGAVGRDEQDDATAALILVQAGMPWWQNRVETATGAQVRASVEAGLAADAHTLRIEALYKGF